MKTPRGSTKEQIKRDPKDDLMSKGIYKGELPSIVGRQRLLVRSNGKESFIYVDEKAVSSIEKKYGKDFIRNCGTVIQETKRVNV